MCPVSLAQQEPKGGFEVIVVDGISEDGTRQILERLVSADSRLRVVDNPGASPRPAPMPGSPARGVATSRS